MAFFFYVIIHGAAVDSDHPVMPANMYEREFQYSMLGKKIHSLKCEICFDFILDT